MPVKCVAPPEKFTDYIFKPDATHGKDKVFRALGYSAQDAPALVALYEQQAARRYAAGAFVVDRADEHGQRVTIEIELAGIGEAAGTVSYLATGWMVTDKGLRLNTPFAWFTRPPGERHAE